MKLLLEKINDNLVIYHPNLFFVLLIVFILCAVIITCVLLFYTLIAFIMFITRLQTRKIRKKTIFTPIISFYQSYCKKVTSIKNFFTKIFKIIEHEIFIQD